MVSVYDIFNDECGRHDSQGRDKKTLFHSFSLSRPSDSIGTSGLEETF